MKTHLKNQIFSKVSLLLMLVISLFSCSKTADTTPATPASTSYISMKINGVLWKSSISAAAVTAGNFSANGTLDVAGVKDILVIQLLNASAVGVSYKLETFDLSLAFSKKNGAVGYNIGKDAKGSSGVLTITKTKVVGTLNYANATFSGTAIGTDKSTLIITEGVISSSQVN